MAAAMDRMGTSTTALYERLGIPPAATDDEIRRAYRYHPDKNRSADPEVFQAINHAYDILGDPKKRAVYDR
ncbi:MAG: DnaJ domain-containing protein [Olpidium bornovanus]|uniref:DnaJ domain-containing protein n=1 Tax=Olpidium bornovanus TaxID=278681 RepID=A0A8H7ZTQ6_9FUNG|nr:MAG: DnaJ domain-containing protein [Olpidium bornovanus]